MTPDRIAGARDAAAPRLIEWTGERMVPWTEDPALAYEHLHRYVFASRLVEGRRVLDLGSGEGYGSALLAARAASVVGVDVDPEAVEHARANYRRDNLSYAVASADDLSGYDSGSFDVVVCFEVIEHVQRQEEVVAEVRRVLGADGLFVCSTPEREVYREATGEVNPYHVRELDTQEFLALLGTGFEHVATWSQRTITGSVLDPQDAGDAVAGHRVYVEGRDGRWDVAEPPAPLYLVAVAGHQPLADAALQSVLVDPDQGLLERARRDLQDARDERAEVEVRLQTYMADIAGRDEKIAELVALADARRAELVDAYATVTAQELQIRRYEESASWQLLERLRGVLRRPDGEPNALGRGVSKVLATVSKLTGLTRR